MSLDERSTVIFSDLFYLEDLVLITRGFHPLDPQMIRSNACVREVVLICLILHGLVIIILNQPKQGNLLIHVELIKRTRSQMQIGIDDSNLIISSHET